MSEFFTPLTIFGLVLFVIGLIIGVIGLTVPLKKNGTKSTDHPKGAEPNHSH